jgi:hypothetical protein
VYRRLHRKPSQSALLESHVSQLVIRHGTPELAIEAIRRTGSHMPDTQARLIKALEKVIVQRDKDSN